MVPLPDGVTVHLDVGYDSDKTRALLDETNARAADRDQRRMAASVNQDRLIQIAVLCVFGILSYLILPSGWELASLPIALVCVTVITRFLHERR